jgi:hypothetical protein
MLIIILFFLSLFGVCLFALMQNAKDSDDAIENIFKGKDTKK